MQSLFSKSGNTYRVFTDEALDLHKSLPAGIYVLRQDPFENLYIETVNEYTVPERLYGNTVAHSRRIIDTFLSRPAATGVMFVGEKGSGKTMTSKKVSLDLVKEGIPTIIVNNSFCGDRFNTFIQNISQPCVIFFDEFEKVYDKDDQERILTLLDGNFPSKKLFMFTVNDSYRVDKHMHNRPGRIYYMIEYGGINSDHIREYCEDNLNTKHHHHINKICEIAGLFYAFNFDLLKALVEEINRYGESPVEAIKMLNAKPDVDTGGSYTLELTRNGIPVKGSNTELTQNPLARPIDMGYWHTSSEDEDEEYISLRFDVGQLVKVDPDNGQFTFKNNDYQLVVSRKQSPKFNYAAF